MALILVDDSTFDTHVINNSSIVQLVAWIKEYKEVSSGNKWVNIFYKNFNLIPIYDE